MVSQEVSVDIKEFGYGSTVGGNNDELDGVEMLEMRCTEMGTSGRAMKEADNPETFVDTLFARCIKTR